MTQAILYKKDIRNAYVIKASRADFFITVLNHYGMRDGGPIFRIMKEHIGMYVPTQIMRRKSIIQIVI